MSAVENRPAGWWETTRQWIRGASRRKAGGPRIGLALGGGFARGIAHIGVLRALEKNRIPISMVTGVSSGAIVAAAMASGCSSDDIERVALSMKFRDVARWTLSVKGLAGSERMIEFLARLLKVNRFEDMKVPLGIVATDLITGRAIQFHGKGDVVVPIRASCSYPGLFLPIRYQGKLLVDGFVSMEVPAHPLIKMGADHVISVNIPNQDGMDDYGNMLSVISRCFQIMGGRTELDWKRYSSVVITPPVANMAWDSFESAKKLIELGEQAAMAAMPGIKRWLESGADEVQEKTESLPLAV
ncbi:MAG TPA: patatin-like phospholipase family protein [Bryobacteraceae bacterium]|nr:patatin-like phospholipase family protein [Bryobacteraceae bacterium]